MQVTLVYCVKPIDEYNIKILQPLGIAYIAAVLEEFGYNVLLVDAQHEKSFSELVHRIVATRPEVLGIAVYSLTYSLAKNVLKSVLSETRPLLTILGGPHIAACHIEAMRENQKVDVAVRGEGEYTTLEVIEHFEAGKEFSAIKGITYRDQDRIITNPARPPIKDLDSLPLPARHLLHPLKDYGNSGTLVSSRGCPYRCSFCSIHHAYGEFGGSQWRPRSPQNVVDEIEILLSLGANTVDFVDDNFLLDEKRAAEIAEEIIRRNLDVNYQAGTRADLLIARSAILPLLRKSGCRKIEIGLENGSPSVLQRYGKRINPRQNAKAIQLIRSNDLVPIINWIMFDAETTVKELMENLDFIERNRIEDSYRLFATWLWPHPGTEIYQRYKEKQWLVEDDISSFAYKIIDDNARRVFTTFLQFLDRHDRWLVTRDHYLRDIVHLIRAKIPDTCSEKKRLERLEEATIKLNLDVRCLNYKIFKQAVLAANEDKLNSQKQEAILCKGDLLVKNLKKSIRNLCLKAKKSGIRTECDYS